MARKKAVTKMPRMHEMIDTKTEDLLPQTPPAVHRFPVRKIALAIVIVGILAILISNKGLLVAATVNGRPIFRWQLTSVLRC